jgi:hypothetical protein
VLLPDAGCGGGGKSIATVEGIADGDKLHPLAEEVHRACRLQCGICTPGFLVAANRCWKRRPIPPKPKFATGWQATCADARLRQDRARRARCRCRDERSLTMQEKVKDAPGSEFSGSARGPERPDGVDKVTGRARFGADMAMAGQLTAWC